MISCKPASRSFEEAARALQYDFLEKQAKNASVQAEVLRCRCLDNTRAPQTLSPRRPSELPRFRPSTRDYLRRGDE